MSKYNYTILGVLHEFIENPRKKTIKLYLKIKNGNVFTLVSRKIREMGYT